MTASSARPFRVHFLGNTCNNHYLLAKAMRAMGVDAHLFYNAGLHWQTHPAADDPEVADAAPDWLHPYTASDEGAHPFRAASPSLAARIADCDLIHAEDVGVIWAAQSGRPYVWDPYGFDVQFYGFHHYWRKHWHPAHPERVLAPLAWRQAVAGVGAAALGLWYEPLAEGFAQLEALAPGRFHHHIALATDTDVFSPGAGPSMQALLERVGSPVQVRGLTVFHPVRIMFTEHSYVNKANDRLIRAVGRMHAAGHEITLVLSDRGTPCEPAARALIAELGLTDRVAWIPSVPRRSLVDWYRAADITADEFEGGALGSVAFESLACGTPLLTRLLESHDDPTFWSPRLAMPDLPPLLQARTEDEITAALERAVTDRAWLSRLGEASRAWMLAHGSPPAIAEAWLQLYRDVLTTRSAGGASHGWQRPLPAPVTPTPRRDAVLAQLTGADARLDADALLLALDECPDDPQLIAGLVAALRGSGQAALGDSVLAYAAELLPASFPLTGRPVSPVHRDLTQLDDVTLLREAQDALASRRVGEALAAVDVLRARHPGADNLLTLRRTIVAAVTPAELRVRIA